MFTSIKFEKKCFSFFHYFAGTHLYVLYEGYGYSVASLYSLGYISGTIMSPFIGPFVDRFGRKNAAILYCILEIVINFMEQYPKLNGLIACRVIGGITTNLLSSVFESWLRTEYQDREFPKEKLEVILRDSTIASTSATIVSGYIAHMLASVDGAVGPFKGAVAVTGIALLLIVRLWTENFGSSDSSTKVTTFCDHMVIAYKTIVGETKISRIGLIQGLTDGSLQTFVLLWAPALRYFSVSAPSSAMGLDVYGEPAYGLIFGAFMSCGVIGSLVEPSVRKIASLFGCWVRKTKDREEKGHAFDVCLLSALCYFSCAILLCIPCLVEKENSFAFSICLGSFLLYELMVGLYKPCEGMIRSIYMPNESICSLMTMLRVIMNLITAVAVLSTNYISLTSGFIVLVLMMFTSACLQLSLIII